MKEASQAWTKTHFLKQMKLLTTQQKNSMALKGQM